MFGLLTEVVHFIGLTDAAGVIVHDAIIFQQARRTSYIILVYAMQYLKMAAIEAIVRVPDADQALSGK